jgi:hypothetical protein
MEEHLEEEEKTFREVLKVRGRKNKVLLRAKN